MTEDHADAASQQDLAAASPADALAVLLEALQLKAVDRAGWVRRGLARSESVAAHSWGVAWLVLALAPPELDLARALAYAVLHDLPEVRAGDIVPADGVTAADKHAREATALSGLLTGLPGAAALTARWDAYEAQTDPEARFVRQLDRLDMALQAAAYAARDGLDPREFLASAAAVIDHPCLVPLLATLRTAPPRDANA